MKDRDSFLAAIGFHVQLQLDLDPTTNEEGFDGEARSTPLPDVVPQTIGAFDLTEKMLFL